MRRRAFIMLLGGIGLFVMGVAPGHAAGTNSGGAVDHLSVPGPIAFGGESYQLSWTSHPTPDYYLQEYLAPGQTSERFQRMVLINAFYGDIDAKAAAAAKINDLNKRKATDPLVNFAVIQNPKTGEIILDFIISSEDADGGTIVEWNAYRYASLKGQGAKAGVLLFGISRRAYGDDASGFLRGLKAMRPGEIDALANQRLPVVQPLD